MYKPPPHSDTDRQSDQVAHAKDDQLYPLSCATADASAVKDQAQVKEQAGYQLEAPAHPLSSPPVTFEGQGKHRSHISSVSPSSSACLGTTGSSSSTTTTTTTIATAATTTTTTSSSNAYTTISASASTDLNTSGTTFNNTSASTTDSAIASFSDLPLQLQSSILAHAVAPPSTCKAAAAIKEDPCLLAIWLGNNNATYAWRISTAAETGKWQVVSQMVSMGFRYEPDDLELSFVLCDAAKAGQLEVVKQLLEAGAWESTAWSGPKIVRDCGCGPTEWDGCDYWDRWTDDEDLGSLMEQGHPFVSAARNGHADVCSLLLKQGIHVGVVHDAVCAAAAGGHLQVIQRLLQEGPAGLSQLAGVSNAMFEAAAGGHLDVVQFFLGQGADLYSFRGTPWAGDSDFTCCLEAAAAGGCPELLQLLLNDYGMAVEPDWPKVLEAAVRSGNDKAVHVLLIAAAAEGQDGEVDTSAGVCSCSQAPELVMQEASDLQLQQQQQQQQQQFLAELSRARQLLQLQSLLPSWAKLDAALLLAVKSGHTKVAALLLACGGSRFSQDLLTSALKDAASKGLLPIMPSLIMLGAVVNVEFGSPSSAAPPFDSWDALVMAHNGYPIEHQCTPLGKALIGGQWAAAELLMGFGAHADHQTLAFATYKHAPARTVKLMLEIGARDLDSGAVWNAAYSGQQDVVELLLGVDQHSVSCERLAVRFMSAISGAVHGRQPQVVEVVCLALSRAQDSRHVAAADRQDVLNQALLLAVRAFEHSLQQVVVPAPAAINQLGGQGLPAAGGQAQAGDGQAADDVPPAQHQQPVAQDAHTTQQVKRVDPASPEVVRMVQCLLQHGADPDHEQGEVLAQAIHRQYMEGAIPCQDHAILQLLLDAGANNIDLALSTAAATGDTTAFPKLLAAAQGPADQQGKALVAAATRDNTSMVRTLIHRKANVDAALRAAAATSNVQAATVILEHPQVRVTDQGLKQQLVDLAARSQSFSLLWALSKSVGMLDDCELPQHMASKDWIARKKHFHYPSD